MPKKNPLIQEKYIISAEYWIPEIGEHLIYSLTFYAGPAIHKHSEIVHSHVRKLNDICYSTFLNAELKMFYLIKDR